MTKRPRKRIREEINNLQMEVDASLSLADDFAKRGEYAKVIQWINAVRVRTDMVTGTILVHLGRERPKAFPE